MKRIYLIVGLVIILTVLMVGCSTEDKVEKQEVVQQSVESDLDKEKVEDSIVVDEVKPEEVEKQNEEIFSTVLIEMMKSKHYTMMMNTIVDSEGKEMAVQTTTVVADGQTAVTMEAEGLSMTTIIKDNKAYAIMHDQKMIIMAPIPTAVEEPGLDEIDFDKLEYLGKGKGMFLGNERSYEEYKVDTGIVRYYFDGKELDGMEVIADEGSAIMDIQFFSNEVDMSIFELPKDYMQIGK